MKSIVELVANVEDARACKDISDEACREVPRNFGILVAAQVLTKLGDALASPKTVLAWLMDAAGAPGFLIGLLVPVRESLSMLPQLFIGGVVRARPRRKPVWLLGSVLQFLAVAGMGLAAFTLRGAAAGWAILGCVTFFSLARGLNSVASKDILGKTIPKRRRGRLGGISAGVSGALSVGVGLLMLTRSGGEGSPLFYGALLAGAGALWLLAALVFTRLEEEPGETAGGANGLREALGRLALLRDDAPFRRFVTTRALLLCSALTAPYYVLLARQHAGEGLSVLAAFIVANGLAASLSAPFWGIFADASSRRVLIAAATLTAALGLGMFTLAEAAPGLLDAAWLHPVAFFLLGVAHSGVRAGRKTYLVDMAGGVKRTDYVSVSNSVIGGILLLTGVLTGALSFLPPHGVIAVLSAFGAVGAAMARSLPPVD
ncbi:MAG TPA: MFS transporter [Candidatus Krumholzibacteria bacterium]|nr:MFS transporter [Candidatus Krumholzibacteria bacterium]HRX51532.1 MFS transporter [Candidatus Krumholzibacteria bacterium]